MSGPCKGFSYGLSSQIPLLVGFLLQQCFITNSPRISGMFNQLLFSPDVYVLADLGWVWLMALLLLAGPTQS